MSIDITAPARKSKGSFAYLYVKLTAPTPLGVRRLNKRSVNLMDFSKINPSILLRARAVHFIGIGGIGTSAIARMFLLGNPSETSERVRVSGSDMAESEVTKALRKAGATIVIGEDIGNIPADCDLVIYTIAIPEDHPELMEAKKRGIPVISYPEALGIISKEKYTIAITGTHGKTTTTAMVAKILIDAGLDPTVIIGSFLLDVPLGKSPLTRGALPSSAGGVLQPHKAAPFVKGDEAAGRTNFVTGKSKYLVVEGCEYRRSFLNLHPKVLVITNIDADHLDYYKDVDDITSAFTELSAKIPKDGFLLVNSHAPNLDSVMKNSRSQNGDWGALVLPEGFRLKVPGKHNLANARAALSVAKALGIGETLALKSLSEFSGTWRRFEYRGMARTGAIVYDDYGHHPHEIEATLQGAREAFPTQRIIVVFQPHLYSRTGQHLVGFGKCFARADSMILLPIYAAREIDPGDINSEMVVTEIKKSGQSANFVNTFAEAAALARELSSAGDLILTLGAGETNRVADILVKR